MRLEKLPLYLLLMFTAVYMIFAKDTDFWNGAFFVSNYSILTLLFMEQKDKWVRILGCSLSLCIFLFSVLKFFISLDQEKLNYYNILTFSLIAFALYKLEPK